MTETLRDKEEMLRIESENVRRAREELSALKRKVEQHDEIMSEKDRGVQVSFFRNTQCGPLNESSLTAFLDTYRSCTMRYNPLTSNSTKSLSVTKRSKSTTPPFFNDGSTTRTMQLPR